MLWLRRFTYALVRLQSVHHDYGPHADRLVHRRWLGTPIAKRPFAPGELRPVAVISRALGGQDSDPPRDKGGRSGYAAVGPHREVDLESLFRADA